MSCDLINLAMSLQVLQECGHFYFTVVPDPKGSSAIIIFHHSNNSSTSLIVTRPNIFVNVHGIL